MLNPSITHVGIVRSYARKREIVHKDDPVGLPASRSDQAPRCRRNAGLDCEELWRPFGDDLAALMFY
jgi:hypothetical protein